MGRARGDWRVGRAAKEPAEAAAVVDAAAAEIDAAVVFDAAVVIHAAALCSAWCQGVCYVLLELYDSSWCRRRSGCLDSPPMCIV